MKEAIMLRDELAYHLAEVLGEPSCAVSPAQANLFIKVIMLMGIETVKIKNSILSERIFTNGGNSYSIMWADLKNTIGLNVNLEFELSKEKKRLLKQLNGNHTLLFYNQRPGELFVTNGDHNFSLMKPKKEVLDIKIPIFAPNETSIIHTDKASNIKSLMRSSKYVDLLIYNGEIAAVSIPGLEIINFQPLATAEYLQKVPDLWLRSYHFLYISAPEVSLEMGKYQEHYWLHTSINVTDQQSISQYEKLTVFAKKRP